jgi:hypothetical protein
MTDRCYCRQANGSRTSANQDHVAQNFEFLRPDHVLNTGVQIDFNISQMRPIAQVRQRDSMDLMPSGSQQEGMGVPALCASG